MREKVTLKISDMHCHSCSAKIQDEIGKMNVEKLNVSYEKGKLTCVTEKADEIIEKINEMGYTAQKLNETREASVDYKKITIGLVIFLGLYIIIKNISQSNYTPNLQEQVSYPILFTLGILTSLHCISMCGGIVLSQSITFKDPIKSTALYNVGRVVAYTIIGGIVGGIGSIFNFSPALKGYITILAGGFMVFLGLSMLESFQFLKGYIKIPTRFKKSKLQQRVSTPLFIGLATGMMPCGPLQTVQLYALGTGSVVKGAISMFVFSIGTVPLMMGLGSISGYMSRSFNRSLLKVCAVLVMSLGLIMINRGLVFQARGESHYIEGSQQVFTTPRLPEIVNGFQFITTSANQDGYEPRLFIVEKGRTVKWMIRGDELTDCNNEIMIPSLGMIKKIEDGHNLLEFTPQEEGEINFSCWKGVLEGQFIVVEDLNNIPDNIAFLPAETLDCCTR